MITVITAIVINRNHSFFNKATTLINSAFMGFENIVSSYLTKYVPIKTNLIIK